MMAGGARSGVAYLPLHDGRAPAWLFARMQELARQMAILIVGEFGAADLVRKLADPFWFQCFGCVLGFDWHSSGVTTTALGALKEGIRGLETDLGFFVAGGKGGVSRQTPHEIAAVGDRLAVAPGALQRASRGAAKVDSAAVQDGYQLYHHCFVFTREGTWAVIQQGMNVETRYARRYHWLSEAVVDFVCEPHLAVCCDATGPGLNMVAAESGGAREAVEALAREHPDRLMGELRQIARLELPAHHHVVLSEASLARLQRIFVQVYEEQPQDFRALLSLDGVGPATIRALALLAELAYGQPASFRDPARFSFAHGGKDGHPFPVNRAGYDRSIEVMRSAILRARLGNRERLDAIRRLARFGTP